MSNANATTAFVYLAPSEDRQRFKSRWIETSTLSIDARLPLRGKIVPAHQATANRLMSLTNHPCAERFYG